MRNLKAIGRKYELEQTPTGDQLLLPLADALRSDESALMLREINARTSDLKEEHRWQLITIVRKDRLMEFPRSLGPAINYVDVGLFVILGDNDGDTVDMLMDMADNMRAENQVARLIAEDAADSTLIADAYNHFDERRKRILNKAHFSMRGRN
jgi:hypothetical protein